MAKRINLARAEKRTADPKWWTDMLAEIRREREVQARPGTTSKEGRDG